MIYLTFSQDGYVQTHTFWWANLIHLMTLSNGSQKTSLCLLDSYSSFRFQLKSHSSVKLSLTQLPGSINPFFTTKPFRHEGHMRVTVPDYSGWHLCLCPHTCLSRLSMSLTRRVISESPPPFLIALNTLLPHGWS